MSIADNAKLVGELVKKLGNIDLYEKIMDLRGEILEITQEKQSLAQKVQELEKLLQTRKGMSFKAPFYYQEGDQIPYCPRCFEKDKCAIHVVLIFRQAAHTRWDCPGCQQTYLVPPG